jgi:hypothetical protein
MGGCRSDKTITTNIEVSASSSAAAASTKDGAAGKHLETQGGWLFVSLERRGRSRAGTRWPVSSEPSVMSTALRHGFASPGTWRPPVGSELQSHTVGFETFLRGACRMASLVNLRTPWNPRNGFGRDSSVTISLPEGHLVEAIAFLKSAFN